MPSTARSPRHYLDFFGTRFFGLAPDLPEPSASSPRPSISECRESKGNPRLDQSIRILVEVPQQDLGTFQNAPGGHAVVRARDRSPTPLTLDSPARLQEDRWCWFDSPVVICWPIGAGAPRRSLS